jgi:3-phenylpropionate/trans-cinnamate dioxygenase ferredoxin subunit
LSRKIPVKRLSEFPPGSREIIHNGRQTIGVFNIDGRLHALRNHCPHQGAPLCLGMISGTTIPGEPYEYVYGRENEIITCPWHGWEFEIATGKSIFNPHRVRVRSYEVTVEHQLAGSDGVWFEEDEDPVIPTYDVSVEDGWVVVHV